MVALAISLLASFLIAGTGSTSNKVVDNGETAALSGWNTMPLAFEPNAGQTDASVRFLAHGNGGTAFFTPSQLVVALRDQAVLRVGFVGATGTARVQATQLQEGKVSYLIGNDPAKWHRDLPTYGSVTYTSLYPGIDLAYSGTTDQLESVYTLAPGADPSLLRWSYIGAKEASVDENDNMKITLASSGADLVLMERAPIAWQEIGGQKHPVDIRFQKETDGEVGFELAAYDRSQPLTIDPILTFSTYLGGSGDDTAQAVSVEYNPAFSLIAGWTMSTNFPVQSAWQPTNHGNKDAFITRMRSNATSSVLVNSTYLGGSGDDIAYGVATEQGGEPIIVGSTTSTDFPTASAYQNQNAGGMDAFVSGFNDNGGLTFSTYLGGNADDAAYAIAAEPHPESYSPAVNIYVTGSTASTNFPILGAFQSVKGGGTDAFLTRFNNTYTGLSYSTYLGGALDDSAHGVAVDGSQNAIVTGSTASINFPTANAYQSTFGGGATDAFVTSFASSGASLNFSTYLGGNGDDHANGVAIYSGGYGHVVGATNSTNFPVVNAFQATKSGGFDAFITKLSSAGLPAYSTYLGGSGDDSANGVAVDSQNYAYLAGYTESINFPVANAIQPTLAGGRDAFLTKFNDQGSALIYSTYLGGAAADEGLAVAVPTYEAAVAVVAGDTLSELVPYCSAVPGRPRRRPRRFRFRSQRSVRTGFRIPGDGIVGRDNRARHGRYGQSLRRLHNLADVPVPDRILQYYLFRWKRELQRRPAASLD